MLYETDLGYSTAQIVFFRKRDLLVVAFANGSVLFWELDRLMSRGRIPGKKMIKMLHSLHSK